jgi:hypothetical protein
MPYIGISPIITPPTSGLGRLGMRVGCPRIAFRRSHGAGRDARPGLCGLLGSLALAAASELTATVRVIRTEAPRANIRAYPNVRKEISC